MRLPLSLVPLLALAACQDPTPAPDTPVTPDQAMAPAPDAIGEVFGINEAFARAAPAGGVSAMFMHVVNGTSLPDTITAVRVEAAGRTEIHRTEENADGLSEMVPVEGGIAIGTNATVSFEPGGLHVMLYDLRQDLVEGDLLDVTLELANRDYMTTVVPVRGL